MKGKRKSTLYLFVCLTCLVNHNPLFAKQSDREDIRFVNTSINKIESSLSEREKKESKIAGKITDSKGDPIIGATIKVLGGRAGTVSDADGNYQLSAPPNSQLQVSYVGYTTKELSIKGRSVVNVVLYEDTKLLEELVVIGYGAVKRRSITGAVDQVKQELLEDKPVANVTQALQGVAPNLIIQCKSYNPTGENTNINIRGISTINSNAPLIVIDGLVSSDGSLNDLNPNDIENISILKDAGAASIYGSRSSNGVILVTTKKGLLNNPTQIRLSSGVGYEIPHLLFHPVEGYQNATLKNLALVNSNRPAEFTPTQIQDLYAHRHEESWFMDQIFRSALQQNHNLSVSGGTASTTYMISLGYYNQESNYVGNKTFGMQRYNLRSNLTTNLKRIKLQALLSFTQNNAISPTGGAYEIDASRTPPYYYYKMKDQGKYLLNNVLSEFNPLGTLEAAGRNKFRNHNFVGNLNAQINLMEGLSLRGVLGVDVGNQTRYTRTLRVPYYYHVEDTKPSHISNEKNYTDNWNYNSHLINSQLLLDYNKSIHQHNFSGLFGITNESYTGKGSEIKIYYTNPDLGTQAYDKAIIPIGEGSTVYPENTIRTSITSVLGRLAYNYSERYYAEFNFRNDASSKFSKKHRWGFFPSLSLAWRLTSEPWMHYFADKVGEIKLRGSYGVLGNQTIGIYDRYTTYSLYPNTYAYNNVAVTGAGFTLGSEDLQWEKTKTLNLGVDASILKNCLNIAFDYYYKYTSGILMHPVVPSVFGTVQNMDNIGEMSNEGWELSLNYRFKTGKVNHQIIGNIGDTFNKLKKFPRREEITSSDEIRFIRRIGVPLGSYYGYKKAGHFQSYREIETSALPVGVSVQPGDNKYVDRNNDGIIDSRDRFILGNAFPRYTFGLTYSLEWKGIDFSVFAQGVGKRDMMIRGELIEPFHENYSYVIYKHQLDFWTPTNTNAKYPRLTAPGSSSTANNYRQASDMYMLNAAYVRIKNITIGYSLPQKILHPLGINKARIYVTAQNLFTFSHNSFIDPESSEFNNQMGNNGANSARNYPTLRYFGMGIDVQF